MTSPSEDQDLTPEEDAEAREFVLGMLQECMESEDALHCAIDAIEAVPDELADMKPRLVLVTAEDCVHCPDTKTLYDEYLKSGKIQETPVETEDGLDIVSKNNLDHTPALLLLDAQNKLVGELFDPNRVEGEEVNTSEPPSY